MTRTQMFKRIVREAVEKLLASEARPSAEILRSTAGLWADRADLPPTEQYLRGLRRGARRGKRPGLQ